MSTLPNTRGPFQQSIGWHEIEDSLWIKLGPESRGYAEFNEVQLGGTVRVRSDRNEASFLFRDSQQINGEILAVRIAVNFNSFVEFRRQSKDPCPIGAQAKTKVVDTPARMTKDVN